MEDKREYLYATAIGKFNGNMITDNSGNTMPVLWADEVYPSTVLCQAIKDESLSKIFVLEDASLITLDMSLNPINQFYFLPQDMIERNTQGGFLMIEDEIEKYKYYNAQHYFEYDYIENRNYAGLYDKSEKKYDLYALDQENGTLEGLVSEKLTAEERQRAIDEVLSRQKQKTIEEDKEN